MLRTHGRYDYAPIVGRPKGRWPNGQGLAVYVALNLEQYAWGEGLVEDLVPGIPAPDVLNNSWRDYGNRVGAWRLLELLRAHALPVSLLVNSELYEVAPQLIAAFRDYGAEIASHGRTNSEHQAALSEADERALIDHVTATIAGRECRPPAGWLSPWIAETERTPDLLQEACTRRRKHDADDVDPDPIEMTVLGREPRGRETPQSRELDACDSLKRRSESDRPARLDLDRNRVTAIPGHDVDLSDGTSPVAREHLPALVF